MEPKVTRRHDGSVAKVTLNLPDVTERVIVRPLLEATVVCPRTLSSDQRLETLHLAVEAVCRQEP